MLTYMRKHSRSWFIKLIFGAIIITFVAWGGSSYLAKEQSKVAKIDKHIITIQQYNKAYSDTINAYEQQYGDMFTAETIKMLKLKEKVLDQLINAYIMEQEAKRIGLTITDEELQDAIQSVPAFLSGGAFDMERYRAVLDRFQINPQQFEDQQRQQMIRERLYNLITENEFVTTAEIEATYHERQDDYELNFITLTPKDFTQNIVPAESEITARYDSHKESYKVPPKTSIAYIVFDATRDLGSVNVSPEEAEEFFNNRKDDYTIPAKVRARQIVVKVPADADEKVFAAKEQEAKTLFEQAKTAPDFAALAKAKSQDPDTAALGGDMGLIEKNKTSEELGNVLFSMKPGDIRGPVRMSQGFAIVKLEEKIEAQERTLEEVKDQVMQILKERKAKDLVYDEANRAFTAIYEDPKQDIAAYAKKAGLALNSFGPFAENEQLSIAMGAKIAKEAFSRPVGDLGDLVETGNGFILYKVMDRIPSRIPELKEVRQLVIDALVADKAKEVARKRAQEIAALSIEERAAMNPESTGIFKHSAWVVPRLGANPRIKQELDSLKSPKVYDLQGKIAVVWLKQFQKADPAMLGADESKKISADLLERKKQLVFETFMDAAKSRHSIVIERNKIL